MALHNDIGKMGEDMAASYLLANGYKIRERNWKLGDLETDIIAEKDGQIVFIEVKTRNYTTYYPPERSVDYRRKRRLSVGAQAYIRYHSIDLPWRFDIIAIVISPEGKPQLNHIEGAFMPPMKTYGNYHGTYSYKSKRSSWW